MHLFVFSSPFQKRVLNFLHKFRERVMRFHATFTCYLKCTYFLFISLLNVPFSNDDLNKHLCEFVLKQLKSIIATGTIRRNQPLQPYNSILLLFLCFSVWIMYD